MVSRIALLSNVLVVLVSGACTPKTDTGSPVTAPAAASEPAEPIAATHAREPAAQEPAARGNAPEPTTGSFASDLQFLKQHAPESHGVQLLVAPHGGRIAISPAYQARVMTSAVSESGKSLGWVNREFIASGRTGTQFDNYGGEDRFWLGPEAGQYGLYFPAGKAFEFDNWQTPAAFQEGAWQVTEQNETSIAFTRNMQLSNYSGTRFELSVERRIALLDAEAAEDALGRTVPEGVQWVGFQSSNSIENTGKQAWTKQGGLLSIWILGMFTPASDTWAILPFDKQGSGPVVNDDYFGAVPDERLVIDEEQGVVFFRCDGQYRSKIGLNQSRSKSVLGSYSAETQHLTLVHYDLPKSKKPYVNSLWKQQKQPYGGDVVNSYNDGPTEPGKPALGGFYELETSSPGAALASGQSLQHTHQTFHFVGQPAALEAIATEALGVSLKSMPSK